MVFNDIIHGRFVDMKSITLEDAEFSYKIRSDDRNKDIVGRLASSIEEQKKFIEWQMKQEGDYYFVVYNKLGEKIGLTGVYNIEGDVCETGREVSYGSPVETMETELLLEDFCRNVLHVKIVTFVIYLSNKKQIKIQEKKGLFPINIVERGGIECAYYEIRFDENNSFNNKIRKLLERIGD